MFQFGTSQGQPQSQPSSLFSFKPTTQIPNAPQPFAINTQANTSYPSIAQPVTGIPFPKETLFADLPADLRLSLESLEKLIRTSADQQAMLLSKPLLPSIAHELGKTKRVEERIKSAEATVNGHKCLLGTLKKSVNSYWRYGETTARSLVHSRNSLPPADCALLQELVASLTLQYASLAATVKELLTPPSSCSLEEAMSYLKLSLGNEQKGLTALAGEVALFQEDLDRLKDQYRLYLYKHRSDARDPFQRTKAATMNALPSALSAQQSAPPMPPIPSMAPVANPFQFQPQFRI